MSAIGVTLDLMIHDIDLLLTMLDSPVDSFEAIGASLFTAQDDISNVRLRFKNGCIADITASRASFERSRRMRVYQEDSYVSVDFMNGRIKVYRKKADAVKTLKDVDVSYPAVEKQQPIRAELTHFIDCINNSKKPWPSGERGSAALRLALEITEKLQRYNLFQPAPENPSGPMQVMSDMGKAAKVAISETIRKFGVDKS
jgi:predicted dehydrogenase